MKLPLIQRTTTITFYLCWTGILFISLSYFVKHLPNTVPNLHIRQSIRYNLHIPIHYFSIDPLIYTAPPYAQDYPPNKVYSDANFAREHYETIKNTEFYSFLGKDFYSKTSFRSDFKNYPSHTLSVLICRLLTYICIVLFLYWLSTIMKAISFGEVYAKSIQRSLYFMGAAVVTGAIIRTIHSAILANHMSLDPSLVAWHIFPDYKPLWFGGLGLALLLISLIFGETIKMHEEQKLTI